jgi:hypothetical protein
MDLETADAIGTLGDEVRRVEMTLGDEVRRVETTLRGEMLSIRDELRHELTAGLADNRRHAELLTESVRDDIRIVAERLAVVGAKLDGLR